MSDRIEEALEELEELEELSKDMKADLKVVSKEVLDMGEDVKREFGTLQTPKLKSKLKKIEIELKKSLEELEEDEVYLKYREGV